MRADARRNHQRILAAARDLVVERGPDVPLEEVARRAGVGIGTVYRRFPDRDSLLRAVALRALAQTAEAARLAREEHDVPIEALTRYLRDALELRVSAVMPALLDVLDMEDPELRRARDESAEAMETLVDEAQSAGQLMEDITFADIGTMLVRIARPLPGPMPDELKHELARRHLELFVRSLLPGRTEGADLPGPALTRSQLRDVTRET